MPGLCRASGMCSYIREWHEGEGDDLTYWCEARRRDDPNPVKASFSVADAKKAGLWQDKPTQTKSGRNGPYEVASGPWYGYSGRMQQMRARGFCLRDAFPDVLRGLISAEEAGDIPFEATGLTPATPPPSRRSAEGEDADRAEAAEAEAARKRAAATDTGLRGDRKVGQDQVNAYAPTGVTDPKWERWLIRLNDELNLCLTRDEAAEVAGRKSVTDALMPDSPTPFAVKREITALLAAAHAVLPEDSDDKDIPATDADPPKDDIGPIKGEEYAAA
jgi:hypothetical protein